MAKMTNPTSSRDGTAQRTLACARCGTTFGCDLGGGCWCMDEAFRVPMPLDGGDCVCPTCLRAMAQSATARS
jgi:hypothetical protein